MKKSAASMSDDDEDRPIGLQDAMNVGADEALSFSNHIQDPSFPFLQSSLFKPRQHQKKFTDITSNKPFEFETFEMGFLQSKNWHEQFPFLLALSDVLKCPDDQMVDLKTLFVMHFGGHLTEQDPLWVQDPKTLGVQLHQVFHIPVCRNNQFVANPFGPKHCLKQTAEQKQELHTKCTQLLNTILDIERTNQRLRADSLHDSGPHEDPLSSPENFVDPKTLPPVERETLKAKFSSAVLNDLYQEQIKYARLNFLNFAPSPRVCAVDIDGMDTAIYLGKVTRTEEAVPAQTPAESETQMSSPTFKSPPRGEGSSSTRPGSAAKKPKEKSKEKKSSPYAVVAGYHCDVPVMIREELRCSYEYISGQKISEGLLAILWRTGETGIEPPKNFPEEFGGSGGKLQLEEPNEVIPFWRRVSVPGFTCAFCDFLDFLWSQNYWKSSRECKKPKEFGQNELSVIHSIVDCYLSENPCGPPPPNQEPSAASSTAPQDGTPLQPSLSNQSHQSPAGSALRHPCLSPQDRSERMKGLVHAEHMALQAVFGCLVGRPLDKVELRWKKIFPIFSETKEKQEMIVSRLQNLVVHKSKLSMSLLMSMLPFIKSICQQALSYMDIRQPPPNEPTPTAKSKKSRNATLTNKLQKEEQTILKLFYESQEQLEAVLEQLQTFEQWVHETLEQSSDLTGGSSVGSKKRELSSDGGCEPHPKKSKLDCAGGSTSTAAVGPTAPISTDLMQQQTLLTSIAPTPVRFSRRRVYDALKCLGEQLAKESEMWEMFFSFYCEEVVEVHHLRAVLEFKTFEHLEGGGYLEDYDLLNIKRVVEDGWAGKKGDAKRRRILKTINKYPGHYFRIDDITQGKGALPIVAINSENTKKWPALRYEHKAVMNHAIIKYVQSLLSRRVYCTEKTCCEKGTKDKCKLNQCGCSKISGVTYSSSGCLVDVDDTDIIYECGAHCACKGTCGNSVVGRGSKVQVEVFMTKEMGWGVRTLQDIPKGAFVAEYAGEVISDVVAEKRAGKQNLKGVNYIFNIDKTENSLSPEEDEGEWAGELSIDAEKIGNTTRFVNHCCDPNVTVKQVYIETWSPCYGRVCFFAKHSIPAGSELTINYLMSVDGQTKTIPCYCGTQSCTGWMD